MIITDRVVRYKLRRVDRGLFGCGTFYVSLLQPNSCRPGRPGLFRLKPNNRQEYYNERRSA